MVRLTIYLELIEKENLVEKAAETGKFLQKNLHDLQNEYRQVNEKSSFIADLGFVKNYKPSVSSKVYSGNGVLISDFSSEKRIFVPFNAIPKTIIYSFLS